LSVPVQSIAWKDSVSKMTCRVQWDVKPYSLTHSLTLCQTLWHRQFYNLLHGIDFLSVFLW